MKNTPRPFRLGKGNGLMWLIGVVGFCGSLLAFVLSFVPPSQIATGSNKVWYSVLIVGCIVMVAIPYIIYAMRKPSWRNHDTDFAPFHWEEQATVAASATPSNSASGNRQAPAQNGKNNRHTSTNDNNGAE